MTPTIENYEDRIHRGGATALRLANEFFGLDHPVFKAFYSITSRLNELRIPYAVAGDMAMVAYGCSGTTARIEIVVTSDGLAEVRRRLEPPEMAQVKFLTAGERDRHQLAVPDPCDAGAEIDGIRYLRVEHLLNMKLSSGIGVTGLKDLAHAVEMIKVLTLTVDFAVKLNPSVRAKFVELCCAVATTN